MMDLVEGYIEDERLQIAYLGQGVIGTNASPHDPGTASIHYHHGSRGACSAWRGSGATWLGAWVSSPSSSATWRGSGVVAAGLAVARIVPGGGELATVEIAGGEQFRARAVWW